MAYQKYLFLIDFVHLPKLVDRNTIRSIPYRPSMRGLSLFQPDSGWLTHFFLQLVFWFRSSKYPASGRCDDVDLRVDYFLSIGGFILKLGIKAFVSLLYLLKMAVMERFERWSGEEGRADLRRHYSSNFRFKSQCIAAPYLTLQQFFPPSFWRCKFLC